MRNKKGLTQGVIIGIIILLISAGIIFLFYRTLSARDIIDKETCHQSVLLRNLPSIEEAATGEGAFKKIFPLKCKTQDILVDYSDAELVKERIANAMYDCWWMLGEGKLSPFLEGTAKEFGLWKASSSCVICSRIEFGQRTKSRMQQVDLTSYLEKTTIPLKDRTYIEYFSNEESAKLPTGVSIKPLQTDKQYAVIFFGFESEDIGALLKKDAALIGGGLAVGGIMFGPKAVIGGISKLVTSWQGLAAIAVGILGQWGIGEVNQHFASVYCDGEKKGCYQLVLTEYSKEGLEGGQVKCDNIESIP